MATDKKSSRYVISGSMVDGAPYTADGQVQPDGKVLFRIPHDGRIKDSTIDIFGDGPKGEFVIEKANGTKPENVIDLTQRAGRKRWHK